MSETNEGQESQTKIVLQNLKPSLVSISELKPHPDNPNKHSRHQIEEIKRQIVAQGVRWPVVRSNLSGHIVAGCGRIEAYKELGFKRVPVLEQDFESAEQEYAFMVADNALQRQSKLDLGLIQSRVVDMGPDFDLSLLAIPNFELGGSPQQEKVAVESVSGKTAVCPECNHRFEIV